MRYQKSPARGIDVGQMKTPRRSKGPTRERRGKKDRRVAVIAFTICKRRLPNKSYSSKLEFSGELFRYWPEVFIGHGWFEPPGLCAKLKLIEKLYTEMRSIYVHSNYISISPFSSAQLCFIAGKH